jgi:uncharacterized repeat protein (TIGR01451 family)
MMGDLRSWSFRLIVLSALLFVASPNAFGLNLDNGITHYVSNDGDDDNNGLTPDTAWATVAKVNSQNFQPGDSVLFACGDTWQAEMLTITWSGTVGEPITFGSYPAGCADKPLLSGAQPIDGWSHHSGNIYVADLSAGGNADRFAYGVNQLFRDDQRLPMGRWPNLDAGDAGYSTIDGQPAGDRITDNELPAGDWTGAVAHIKGMRWYILNRQVTGRSGQTLTLGADAGCWGPCTGWGYFLNNHLNTLDREGEWTYDAATQRVYFYTTGGAPGNGQVEGSVILKDDDRSWGGVTLGQDLWDEVSHVVVDNLAIGRWFRHGIATPTNLHPYENHDVVLQNNTIFDVDGIGINLATWVWDAGDGRPDGWRGGYYHTVSGNVIERANRMGINTYGRDSTFSGNVIRDVGLVENLGAAGMGCDYDAGGGHCTEDGDGIRIKVDEAADSGNTNTLTGNRLERIAHNGMDVFGHHNTFQQNVIHQACYAKGDCGGVRTFGRDDLSQTPVHDLLFGQNLILDAIGNTDGCHDDYKELFGFGFYIDHYSRDVALSNNTVVSSTAHGILYQNSTGTVTGNTLYNNSRTWAYGAQVYLTGSPTSVSQHSGNVLYGLGPTVRTLSLSEPGGLGVSDGNYLFNPYRAGHIRADGDRSLAEWQVYSGKDGNSKEAWFSLSAGDEPRSRIFVNDTAQSQAIDLGAIQYLDLDQNPVAGSLTLPPFSSQVLIASGEVADLALTMNLLSSADTEPGELVTYTLTVENDGVLEAVQVALAHVVPDKVVGVGWQSSPGGVTAQPASRYIWDLPDLANGETVMVTVTGRFSGTLVSGVPLALVGEVTTESPEASTDNNRALLKLGMWYKVYLPVVLR